MPHKHKRKAENADEFFDLPPSARAAPLPVGKSRASNPQPRKKRKVANSADNYGLDDTPKAFSRLLAFQAKGGKRRNGLDDGNQTRKSRAKAKAEANKVQGGDKQGDGLNTVNSEAQQAQLPKIMPGEKLSEFSQRVNAALPLSGIQRTGKKVEGLRDHRITRHEKKLKRLQDGWRKEEARIREKEAEERELAEEEDDEVEAMWEDKTADLPGQGGKGKKKKGGKRKLVAGEVDDKEEDPWKALQRTREQRKGLHDVVQAPPTFERVPREIFKVKNGAKVNVGNVPTSAGSLRKREELGAERQTIIDTYRKMMAMKRDT
ncbi:hypothetical protein K491DRAFT_605387 [Lophiostoma macrostomum CBS 122681]|uniref:Uncharacterized protein n=1 Tax=Lophiostoma macrostomum CBS 122681 TaxID=1314788 RepID=A0A6A6SX96_9PLEO|nr:hypothetical protein K491DRAFT_605387 [Lophiostoma macrostomum CBS 122681]